MPARESKLPNKTKADVSSAFVFLFLTEIIGIWIEPFAIHEGFGIIQEKNLSKNRGE